MDNIHQPMNITEYNNLITNIIESAVDELIQKRESGKESLLLHICRLCAKEEPILLDLSELHLDLINELGISGIDASVGCTKICSTCAEFLGRIREFRCRCEDGQKKISSLLAERSVIPDFLGLDFIKPEEHYGGFSPQPATADNDGGHLLGVDDFPETSSETTEEEKEEEIVKKLKPVKQVRQKNQSKTASKKATTDSRRRVVNGKLQWVCLDCEGTFESCTKLKKHRQTCEMVGNEHSKRRGPFTCDICGQSLPTLMGLRVHVHKHSKSGSKGEQDIGKDANKTSTKLAVCHICGKSFTNTSTLRSHLVFHRQEKRIECQICNKKFHKLYRLKDHLNCHANVRRYSCDICGKAFFTKAILYKHTRSHDQNFRKHQCPMCPIRFAHPYQLRSHMMVHTAEYPHGCKLCSSKFRFTWDLKKHYAKAHPILPEEEDTTVHDPLLEEIVPKSLLSPSEPLLTSLPPSMPQQNPITVGLIKDDQHDDLSVMLANIPPHQQPELTPSVAAVQPVVTEHPFDTDNLLDEASRDFTTDCFPASHLTESHANAEDDFYTFMEC
ncbi:transcription factor Ouib-like [Armigeres subalbatus]|uniref:transcription factor Ouib-like n=1 Tax=Armigeres subalbatus TaxID=124917 RepID=UPI002ED56C4E